MSGRLDRLAELEQAATRGPWFEVGFAVNQFVPGRLSGLRVADCRRNLSEEDAALIAESRNALPALIAVAGAAGELRLMFNEGYSAIQLVEYVEAALARLHADPAGEEA